MSASIGIAVTNRSSERASSLLQDADAAMYRAKRRGGARHELFDEAMHTQAVSRLLTERALRRALDRDELRVLFQPEFDLASGDRVAVEALLRWDHPVRGLVVARRLPAGGGGDRHHRAHGRVGARAGLRGRRAPPHTPTTTHPLTVSTNVSARQLQRPDFPDMVARTAREAGVDPTTLCLEVSESALLDELDTTAEALRALKDIGVQLAIDDFGTGGSSLTYLRRFPFDELKIDRMFVEGLGRSAADDAIVAATIDMAHALDMVVSAEGVETEAQRLRLVDLGCDRAQGYHLGAPEELEPPRLMLVRRASPPSIGTSPPSREHDAKERPMGLLDKVKETAQKGADLAKEGVKAGQDKLDEQKLKKKISDLKEELGGVVYAQKSGTTAEGVDPEVEIARIVAELNAAEAELADERRREAGDDGAAEAAPE